MRYDGQPWGCTSCYSSKQAAGEQGVWEQCMASHLAAASRRCATLAHLPSSTRLHLALHVLRRARSSRTGRRRQCAACDQSASRAVLGESPGQGCRSTRVLPRARQAEQQAAAPSAATSRPVRAAIRPALTCPTTTRRGRRRSGAASRRCRAGGGASPGEAPQRRPFWRAEAARSRRYVCCCDRLILQPGSQAACRGWLAGLLSTAHSSWGRRMQCRACCTCAPARSLHIGIRGRGGCISTGQALKHRWASLAGTAGTRSI